MKWYFYKGINIPIAVLRNSKRHQAPGAMGQRHRTTRICFPQVVGAQKPTARRAKTDSKARKNRQSSQNAATAVRKKRQHYVAKCGMLLLQNTTSWVRKMWQHTKSYA